MLQCDAVLIGGTGIGSRLVDLGFPALNVPTPFGIARGTYGSVGKARLFCVQRHSAGHKTPPHLVNYRAIADAARRLGAKACFATAAVGCLRPEWPVGSPVVCRDFIDHTDRQITMFDHQVKHVDFSNAMGARTHVLAAATKLGLQIVDDGVYMGLDGPRYETPSEILMVRKLGGDLVGMTASSEAETMVESGVPYSCVSIVTNLAAGIADHTLDHSEVVDVMEHRGGEVVKLLLESAEQLVSGA